MGVVVITLLALVGGLIIYSYADWPGAQYFGIADKNFWDYLELLIVPAALAFGVYWLNRTQDIRQQEPNQMQQNRELEVVTQQAQDAALQAYLDQIGQLLLDKDRPLRESKESDEVRTLARARTLTVLARLEGVRKRSVMQVLYESGLITKPALILDLKGADLEEANLGGIDLNLVVLRESYMREAFLREAELYKADLSRTILYKATLNKTNLREANLREAFLHGANLNEADLTGADLSGADLSGADLIVTEMSSADLRGADLSRAI